MRCRQDDYGILTVIIGIIFLVITFMTASSGSLICWLFFGLFILSIIALIIIASSDIPDYQKNIEKRNQISKQEMEESQRKNFVYENEKKQYVDSYGSISKEISYNPFVYDDPFKMRIYIFETSQKILIQNEILNFSDIISFDLHDNNKNIYKSTISTSESSTSTGSLIGRALVGGVLLGGVGAIIGGVTAKKSITTINTPQEESIIHEYIIYITVNSISKPEIIVILGKDINAANELVSILSVIIERNK